MSVGGIGLANKPLAYEAGSNTGLPTAPAQPKGECSGKVHREGCKAGNVQAKNKSTASEIEKKEYKINSS